MACGKGRHGRVSNPALLLGVLIAAGSVASWGRAEPPSPRPLTSEETLLLKPSDARLAALYETSCKSCHAGPAMGAPIVHDAAAWASRWKKGEDELLDNVVVGYSGMPSGGGCAGCTREDLKALVRFLAGREAPER